MILLATLIMWLFFCSLMPPDRKLLEREVIADLVLSGYDERRVRLLAENGCVDSAYTLRSIIMTAPPTDQESKYEMIGHCYAAMQFIAEREQVARAITEKTKIHLLENALNDFSEQECSHSLVDLLQQLTSKENIEEVGKRMTVIQSSDLPTEQRYQKLHLLINIVDPLYQAGKRNIGAYVVKLYSSLETKAVTELVEEQTTQQLELIINLLGKIGSETSYHAFGVLVKKIVSSDQDALSQLNLLTRCAESLDSMKNRLEGQPYELLISQLIEHIQDVTDHIDAAAQHDRDKFYNSPVQQSDSIDLSFFDQFVPSS